MSSTLIQKRHATCPHCGATLSLDEMVLKQARVQALVDWQSLDVEQKLLKVLGWREWAMGDVRWQRRLRLHPGLVEQVADTMHANLNEGSVIKNRGAYAEELWRRGALP